MDAEAETKVKKTAKKVTLPPETEEVSGYKLTHKGHGKYTIEGQTKEFASREDAVSYIADLEAVAAYEKQFGDIIPEGVDVRPRNLEYRGVIHELPMNEQYLPDGGYNPYYDRAWFWGWARATGSDVSDKQARGYRLVTREQLEEGVEDGTIPDHYRSLLMAVDHGNRMLYGDLVLMRIPRVLWRQHQAAKEKAALARVKKQDEASHELLDRAGVKNASSPISNEMTTGLKISGF